MKYVVLGASAAGINAIRELRKLDKDAEIVLISNGALFSVQILDKVHKTPQNWTG